MDKAKKYNKIKLIISISETIISVVFLLILIFTSLGYQLESISYQITSNDYFAFLIFLFLISLISSLIFTPLSFYSEYVLEHKFNLSNQTFVKWIIEKLKGSAITLIIALPLTLIFFYLLKTFPETWWVIFATILFLFSVVLARIAPTLIFPIFYKFTPLEDNEVKERIKSLCDKFNINFQGIYSFNLSKNTKKANAGFTGIRKSKRIILSDTLLNDFTVDEIETVFAHELGHYKKRHILKNIIIGFFINYIALFITAILYNYFLKELGYNSVSQLSAIPLLFLIIVLINLFFMPIGNIISRKYEYEADRFAVEITQKPEAFISTLEKLSFMNLADKSPNKIVEFLFYSHPSINKRIEAIKEIKI